MMPASVQMRVGEILLHHGWLDRATLDGALSAQPATGVRLCSLLIARGELEFDHASRALGEQRGVAAVLKRHLVGRDRSVAKLLSAAVARDRLAVPIGRLGDGSLIVCVRDPSTALHDALAHILGANIVLAVAPAQHLERLVAETYAVADVPIDIDVADFDHDLGGEIDGALDAIERKSTSRTLPVEIKSTTGVRDALDVVIGSFPDIDDIEWLLDVVMEYLTPRWSAVLLLEARGHHAAGVRGHGRKLTPVVVRTFVLDFDDAAILKAARDDRRVIDEPPTELGTDDAQLVAALETTACVAAAIRKGTDVRYLLVLGEPLTGDREDAIVDLGLLVEAMSDAVSRM
jgi:hypothetical protein